MVSPSGVYVYDGLIGMIIIIHNCHYQPIINPLSYIIMHNSLPAIIHKSNDCHWEHQPLVGIWVTQGLQWDVNHDATNQNMGITQNASWDWMWG